MGADVPLLHDALLNMWGGTGVYNRYLPPEEQYAPVEPIREEGRAGGASGKGGRGAVEELLKN